MPGLVHGGDRGAYVPRIRIEAETGEGERRTVVRPTR